MGIFLICMQMTSRPLLQEDSAKHMIIPKNVMIDGHVFYNDRKKSSEYEAEWYDVKRNNCITGWL